MPYIARDAQCHAISATKRNLSGTAAKLSVKCEQHYSQVYQVRKLLKEPKSWYML